MSGWHLLCLCINDMRQALKGPGCFLGSYTVDDDCNQSQSFLLKNVWASLVQKVHYFLK